MKHYLLLVISCCFLFSCEQDYYVDNIAFTPRLVANSVFTEGSEIKVEVYSSRNVLDPESFVEEIEDAQVLLKDANGNLLSDLEFIGDGTYASFSVDLKVGESYTLEVTREGFEPSIATSMIPLQVDANIQNRNFESTGTSGSLNVDMKLVDNDVEDNYYVYEVVDDERLDLIKKQPFNELIQQVKILLTSDDQNQDQIASNSLFQSRVFLKDESFANGEYEISFKAKGNPAAIGPVVLTSEELFADQEMRIVTASKDMYEFYKSLETYRLKGAANSSVTHPVAVYSNSSNGLGIFAGYNEAVLNLR